MTCMPRCRAAPPAPPALLSRLAAAASRRSTWLSRALSRPPTPWRPIRRRTNSRATIKKGRRDCSRRPDSFQDVKSVLDGLEVRGLGATGIRHHVERDLLAFIQGAHAGGFHGGGVHKHVLAAAFRRDEAEALGGIEKLHGSNRHCVVPA